MIFGIKSLKYRYIGSSTKLLKNGQKSDVRESFLRRFYKLDIYYYVSKKAKYRRFKAFIKNRYMRLNFLIMYLYICLI